MKTHHSPDEHICGLSKAVPNCVILYLLFRTIAMFSHKISIPITPLAHDVTLA